MSISNVSQVFQFLVKFRNTEKIDQIQKIKDQYYKDHPELIGNESAFYRMVFLEGIKSLNNKANQDGTTANNSTSSSAQK